MQPPYISPLFCNSLQPQQFMTATGDQPDSCVSGEGDTHHHTPAPARIDGRSKSASRTASRQPTAHFLYRGRRWRIYQRRHQTPAEIAGGLLGPPWQIYWEERGKRHPLSLGTPLRAAAITRAKHLLDARFDGSAAALQALLQRPGGPPAPVYSPLQSIFEAIPLLPIQAGATTRKSYVWSLRWVLRWAGVTGETAGAFCDETAARFFQHITAHAATLPPDHAETFKRSACSIFDNSSAAFSPAAVYAMKRPPFNLVLPDLTDWRNARKVHKVQLSDASSFTPPPPDAQRRMLVEWSRLARPDLFPTLPWSTGDLGHAMSHPHRRNMFVAVGLMLAFGFRKSDVHRARWNWFERDEHGPLCRVRDTTQKNKQTTWEVSAVDPFWRILQRGLDRNGWRGAPEDLCLVARAKTRGDASGLLYYHGGDSDRLYTVFWLVGKWLRWLGWNTQKTNHALRDFTASKLTMRYNLRATAKWCRHSSQSTTERHYSRFESRAEQTQTHRLAWLRWAT